MKILLVQPPKATQTLGGEDYYMYEPLALEYLAAGLRASHDVRLLDMRIDRDLQSTLECFEPDVVGVTAYTVHVNTTIGICGQVKGWNEKTLTVVGGHHATVRPQDFCSPSIDLVVSGEGVFVFKEAVERYETGRELHGLPGLFVFENGQLTGEQQEPERDLDRFPLPDRTLSSSHRHLYFSEWMKPLASLRTSKGCPFRCNFCALWKLTGGRHVRRAPESIVEEIEQIEEPFVFFADDESMVHAQSMDKLAGLIDRAGIRKRFFLYGRSDTIVRHPKLLEKWRDVGLERIFVGLEFFRDEDLARVNKKASVEENEKALGILADLGIETYANFMVRPDFTREDFRTFRRYTRSLPLSFAGFSVLTPLPGTELFEQTQKDLITRNWDHFDFMHTVLPTRLPLKEFYREYSELLKKAIPMSKALSFARKFPLKEIPATFMRGMRLINRVKRAYKDH